MSNEAPERIWLIPANNGKTWDREWCPDGSKYVDPKDSISFTRTDLAATRVEQLEQALREIARQKLISEIEPIDGDVCGDFEFAYEELIRIARAALGQKEK